MERLKGGAVIEIRTVVSPETWVNVTCQVVSASAASGAGKSKGVLTQGEPGLLDMNIYDPDRLLDPNNDLSPYAGLIKPGLWIRLLYDDGTRTLIKSAVIDAIEHDLATSMGSIRANDWVSWCANFPYPNPSTGSSSLAADDTLKKLADHLLAQVIAEAVSSGFTSPFVPFTVDAALPTIPALPVLYGTGTTVGPSFWKHLVSVCETNLYMLYMDRNLVIRAVDSMAPHGPTVSIGINGPKPLGFESRVDAGNIINFVSFVWAAAGPTGGGLTYTRFDDPSILTYGYKTWSPGRPLPQTTRFGSTNTVAPTAYANAIFADTAKPVLEAVPLQIWPSSAAELRTLLNLTPMQQVLMEFDDPLFSAYGRAVGEVVEVTDEGWSVSLVTYIAPADNLL